MPIQNSRSNVLALRNIGDLPDQDRVNGLKLQLRWLAEHVNVSNMLSEPFILISRWFIEDKEQQIKSG